MFVRASFTFAILGKDHGILASGRWFVFVPWWYGIENAVAQPQLAPRPQTSFSWDLSVNADLYYR